MRVTVQAIQNLQITDLKTLESKQLNLVDLLKGESVEAKVADVLPKSLVLELPNQQGMVQIKVPEAILETVKNGDLINISLTETDKIQIDIPKGSVEMIQTPPPQSKLEVGQNLEGIALKEMPSDGTSKASTVVETFLTKHSLPQDPIIKAIVGELIKENHPITKELVQNLKQEFQALNALKDNLTANNIVEAFEKQDLDLKKVAISFLKENPERSEVAKPILERIDQTPLKPIVEQWLQKTDGDIKTWVESFKASIAEMPVEVFTNQFGNKDTVAFKDVVLLVNQMKNIWTDEASFEKVVRLLQKESLTPKALVEFVEILTKPTALEEKMESLEKWVSSLKLEVQEEKQIKTELLFIKENNQLSSKAQTDIMFFQMPLQYKEKTQVVDFFVKRNKRKKEIKEEFQVLVSLNTVHFSEVNCLVTGRKNEVHLKFGLSDETYALRFESQKPYLESLLSSVTTRSCSVEFNIKRNVEETFFSKHTDDNYKATGIDMRV